MGPMDEIRPDKVEVRGGDRTEDWYPEYDDYEDDEDEEDSDS